MTTDPTRPPRHDGRGIANGSDAVARLVRLAERDSGVPAGGADRIRNATRELWRREVARRRLRRLAWTGGLLAAAASALIAVGLVVYTPEQSPGPADVAVVAAVDGAATVLPAARGDDGWVAAKAGLAVAAGSRIRTTAASRVALTLAGGHSMRLDHATEAGIGPNLDIGLQSGGVYVDSGADPRGTVEIHTSLGVTRDIGTQFQVRYEDASLRVSVREGMVAVTTDGEVLQVAAGAGVEISAHVPPAGFAVAPAGPEWTWVQAIAPSFEIEGRTAMELLDWASSETGLWIGFMTPEAERRASETILHGSTGRLRPTDAVELVLPGCGLAARRTDGRLEVACAESPGG